MIVYDSKVMDGLIRTCRDANNDLRDAQGFLIQIQAHNDWNCSEKNKINEDVGKCKEAIKRITNDYDSFLNVMYEVANEWNGVESGIVSMFGGVDHELQGILGILVQNTMGSGFGLISAIGSLFTGAITGGAIAGGAAGMLHQFSSILENLNLVNFPSFYMPNTGTPVSSDNFVPDNIILPIPNHNPGGNSTSGQQIPTVAPELVMSEINERYNRLLESFKSNSFRHECSSLAQMQLVDMGIITGNKKGEGIVSGKNFAQNLINMGETSTGYQCTAYNNSASGFDEIVAQSQNGPITNVVLSFNKGGNFPSDQGHTMLISRIQDGKVYFVDNTVVTCKGKPKTNTGDYEAQCWTIEEFKSFYFKASNNISGVVHLHK